MPSRISETSDRYLDDAASRRVMHMLLALLLGRGIMTTRQLVLVPACLYFWGPEYYGEWLMLSAIPSFLAMSDLGLGTAASNRIALDSAGGRFKEASRIYSSVGLTLITIAFAVTSSVWLATEHTSFSGYEHIQHPGLVLVLLVAKLFPYMLLAFSRGWWIGLGNPARSSHLINLSQSVDLALTLTVLAAGYGAVELAGVLLAAQTTCLVASQAVTARAVFRRSRVHIFTREASPVAAFPILRTGIGYQLTPLWQAIYLQGSILLAGRLFGPEGAAAWGAVRIFVRSGSQLLEVVAQTLSPEFQLCAAEKQWERLRRLRTRGDLLCRRAAIVMVAALLTVGFPAFNFWTQSRLQVPYLAWACSCVSLLPLSLWWMNSEILRSLNRPWHLNILLIVSACVSLATSWLLSSQQLTAMGIGALAFDLVAYAGVQWILTPEIDRFIDGAETAISTS